MRNLLAYARSRLNRFRELLFKGLFRVRFRYDVFISYSHSDAKDYAINLKKQLNRLDFTCFIDEEESPPGLSLEPTIEKALSKSAILVLLITRRAMTRPYVALEVEKFIPTKRTIIPINISGTLMRNNEQVLTQPPWDIINSRKLIWIDEIDDAFVKGNPSPPIADGIDKLFKYTRRNVRVRTEIIGTALLVLLAALGAGLAIKGKAAELSEQTRLTEVAKEDTEKQLAIATAAGLEAERQRDIAARATKEAKLQEQIAADAKKEAERQQEIARMATAEAEKQQQIAKDAKLESDRQLAFAEEQKERGRRLRYVSDMNLAQGAYETGAITRVNGLLKAHLPAPATPVQDDLRSFYWYYLWHNSPKEQGTLMSQSGSVFSVAFSPDGKALATAGSNGTVKLWDVGTQQVMGTLKGALPFVRSVAFSPDGKILAAASSTVATEKSSSVITLWDVETQKELAAFSENSPVIYVVAFSPDGKLIASTDHTSVNLWDVATQKPLATLRASLPIVDTVAFSPDGKTLAAASSVYADLSSTVEPRGLITLWDVGTQKELGALSGPAFAVRSIAFSPDSRRLASSGLVYDPDVSPETPLSVITLWDVETQKQLVTLPNRTSTIEAITFSPDGKTLASGGYASAKLWDVATRQTIATLNEPLTFVHSVAFSPDGKTFAAGCDEGRVKLWAIATRKLPVILKGHSDHINSLAFSPDGKTLASTGRDNTVRLWEVTTRQEIARFQGPLTFINSLAFSPDGKILAAGSSTWSMDNPVGVITLWEVETRKQLATFYERSFAIESIAFSRDGKMLASGSVLYTKAYPAEKARYTVRLWDVAAQKEIARFSERSRGAGSIAFSPDGNMLTFARDDTVTVLEVATLRNLATLKTHSKLGSAVAFSPDGKMLAAAGWDTGMQLWDVAKWQELAPLSALVHPFAFSRDCKTLVSVGPDNTVKLWDLATRQELATLSGHLSTVYAVAFSSDGNMLASAGQDYTIRLWIAATKEEVAAAQSKR